MRGSMSDQTFKTGQEPTAGGHNRTIRLTEKGWRAIEYARRKKLYPELDPEKDWIEIPVWMLNGRQA